MLVHTLQPLCCSLVFGDGMIGRRVVVTGANVGIGFETARALAAQGAHVTLACRDLSKAANAVAAIVRDVQPHDSQVAGRVQAAQLELSDQQSVHRFADQLQTLNQPVHVLVNNAGAIMTKQTTVEGIDRTMAVNHLGPSLLTMRLMPLLRQGSTPRRSARIVNVSSRLEKNGAIAEWCAHILHQHEYTTNMHALALW